MFEKKRIVLNILWEIMFEKSYGSACCFFKHKRNLCWLFVSERKQIALMADEKLYLQFSRHCDNNDEIAIFRNNLLRNEDFYEEILI